MKKKTVKSRSAEAQGKVRRPVKQGAGQTRSAGNTVRSSKPVRKKAPLFATDVTPFIIFAVAILVETCLVLGANAGAVGIAVKDVFYGVFGPVSHALAICALLLAFYYTDLKSYGTLGYKLMMTASFLTALCVAYTLIAQNGMAEAKFSFATFYEVGIKGESGGVYGSFFGFIFSKMFTGAVAAVVFSIATLALLSFCLGRSHIGIWRSFFRYEHTEPVAKEKPSAPTVSAKRVATVIDAQNVALGTGTDNEVTASVVTDALGDGTDIEDDVPGASMGQDSFDIIGDDPNHTVLAVDFGEEENLREKYRPNDLMTDFGFGDEKYGEKPEKPDVYDETPKPVERKPYVPPKRIDMGSPNAYSPFANPLMSFEEFKKQGKTASAATTVKTTDGGVAYSPFSDPVRSMNAPKRNEGEVAPQLYIGTDNADKWEHDQVIEEKTVEIPEPEQVIVAKVEEPEDDDDIPFVPALAPKPAPVPTPAPVKQPTVKAPAFADKDDFGIPAVALDAPNTVASSFETKPSAPVETVSAPVPKAEPVVAPAPAPAPIPEVIPVTPKTDIKSISALNGNTQIDDGVAAPEAATQIYEEPDDDDDYVEEERGINFYTYKHKRYPNYVPPTVDLLDPPTPPNTMSEEEIFEIQSKLLDKLASFKVEASLSGYSIGPSITRYELMPGPGVKSKQIIGLSEDIGLALQSEVRIFTVPDKAVIGVEVPNKKASKVSLRSLIDNPDFKGAKSKITVCVGVTVSGKPIYMNIDDMPHVLVAGQTKSGKSVAINCMLISLIYRASPDEVQLILIDPKRVELSIYSDLPHMVMPVIDDPKRAAAALKWAVAEMERRYQLLSDMKVRNRDEYYDLKDENPNFEYMPQIVIVIDELADLMLQVREHVEELINRLAAMARACGIHLIIGTQRPSADIVTGLIKANIPSRIAFKVANQVDSRIILGSVGAEKLLGRGDMLYYPTGSNQVRAQGAFVDTPEIKRILNFIMDKNGGPQYNPEILYALQTETDKLNKTASSGKKSDDEMDDVAIDSSDIDFDYICKATELVINLGKATTNVIQRHLKVGFNKAANITDQLEELGFISKSQGSSRPREVLVTMQQFLEWKNQNQR